MTKFIHRCMAGTVTALTGLREERGQTFVEYVMIAGLVAIVVAVALTTFAGKIGDALDTVGNSLGF